MLRRALTVTLLTTLGCAAGCGGGGGAVGGGGGPPPVFDLYVDATAGSDANPGTQALPLKTLTAALGMAAVGDEIKLAPGSYNLANGEVFPLTLPPGVAVEGDVPNRGVGATATDVDGGGALVDPLVSHAGLVLSEGSVLRGLKLGSGGSTPVRTAVMAKGVTAEVTECTFSSTSYMGTYVSGAGATEVHHCTFEGGIYGVYLGAPSGAVQTHDCVFVDVLVSVDMTGGALGQIVDNQFLGSGVVSIQVQSGTPQIQGNTFASSATTNGAVYVQFGKPVLRNNSFTSNKGVAILPGADADLGTVASPGLNSFSAVTGFGLKHDGAATIQAQGNTWQHVPPTGGVDIVVTGAGSVVYGPGVNDHVP